MTLRKQISAAGIPQKRPEAIFRQPVAHWITVATQFQSDLELLHFALENEDDMDHPAILKPRPVRNP